MRIIQWMLKRVKRIKNLFNKADPCPVYYVDFQARKLLSKVGNDVTRESVIKAA